MKFDTQSRSSLLIVNMILGRFGLKIAICFNFFKIWHLVQIEIWMWYLELMILTQVIDSDKFCFNTEISSDFYEIWHSQQMEHANYEYNTRHGLERLCDYCLRMIIDCKIRLAFRT